MSEEKRAPEPPEWDWNFGLIAHLDVETDGLWLPGYPPPLMLEIALVLTRGDLRVLDRYEAVIRHPESVIRNLKPPAIVAEMHTKNGLWADLLHGETVKPADAERAMVDMIDYHRPRSGRGAPVVWAGFSPGSLDRPLVSLLMPSLYRRFHHRVLDVSSLKLAMLNFAGTPLPESEASHRAMGDVLEEIEVLRAYREQLGALVPAPVEIALS